MKKAGSFVILLACSLSACIAPALDEESFDESSVVNEVEQELGEPGCGIVTPDATIGRNQSVTSPTTYGSATCYNQYVVKLTDDDSVRHIRLADTPTTQAACNVSYLEIGHYTTLRPSLPWNPKTSVLRGTQVYKGVWSAPSPDPDVITGCAMTLQPGYPSTVVVPADQYNYQVAVRGYQVVNGIQVLKKVYVSLVFLS